MTHPANYTFKMKSAGGDYMKRGDVVGFQSLKGNSAGAGTDLQPQLTADERYIIKNTLCACGALGQTIVIEVDIANSAKVTTAMALQPTIYENVTTEQQIIYFNRKYGFGEGQPCDPTDPRMAGIALPKTPLLSEVGAEGYLGEDTRFAYDPDAAAAGNILTITPNATDVILIRAGSVFAALGDTA